MLNFCLAAVVNAILLGVAGAVLAFSARALRRAAGRLKAVRKNRPPARLVLSAALLLVLRPTECTGHYKAVHMPMTESAALASEGLGAFLRDQLGPGNEPFTDAPSLVAHPPAKDKAASVDFSDSGFAPVAWAELGSYHEDGSLRFSSGRGLLLEKG